MPKHKVHKYVDKIWLGKPYPEVHAAIDRPYIIYGRKHRRLFHTPQEAYGIGSIAGQDYQGGLSGYLHVLTDELCSKDKKFKKWLEYAAKQDAKRTKQKRRKRRS